MQESNIVNYFTTRSSHWLICSYCCMYYSQISFTFSSSLYLCWCIKCCLCWYWLSYFEL